MLFTASLPSPKYSMKGKDRPKGYSLTVKPYKGRLSVIDYNGDPIEIYGDSDAAFALDFAEKEWKIFYNSEK